MSAETLAERILAPGGLTPLYQPIVRTRGGAHWVHSYECLTRGPEGTNLRAADVLFEYVRRKRMETAVDRACIAAALAEGRRIPGAPELSLNVHATTIATDRGFSDFLARCAADAEISTSRLTVEIVEHSPALDERNFLDGLDRLRAIGVRIALDDVGLGQSNYKMVLDASPDYLKIDRFFISHCDTEPRQRSIIQSIAELADRFGAQAIAEGVERREELEAVASYGIDLIQGYFFSQPLPVSAFVDDDGARADDGAERRVACSGA